MNTVRALVPVPAVTFVMALPYQFGVGVMVSNTSTVIVSGSEEEYAMSMLKEPLTGI
jgi:hypothetical protein